MSAPQTGQLIRLSPSLRPLPFRRHRCHSTASVRLRTARTAASALGSSVNLIGSKQQQWQQWRRLSAGITIAAAGAADTSRAA